ncbi:MAG: hypothetical protein M3437_10400 [Chloroflexota bacterium]|nr:hypothetical protein [Chloroflexota bacterium]MDQ5866166.1 hypothetical protein [Chloroflexota bacterium]
MRERLLIIALFVVGALAMAGCNPGVEDANAAPRQVEAPAATSTPEAPTVPTSTPLPTETPRPTETPWPTQVVSEDVWFNIHDIEDKTAAIRGLVVKEDVPELYITPQQLHDYFAAHIGEGYSIEEAQQDEMIAWLMRLIKQRDVDLEKKAVEVHTDGILGFYSPDTKQLFVLGEADNMDPETRATLAHEFTHALQDQHFDLVRLIQQFSHDSDRRLAMRALVEGDATMSDLLYTYYHEKIDYSKQEKESVAVSNAQEQSSEEEDMEGMYVARTIYFPYIQGSDFVYELTKVGGYSTINQSYQDPPVSSEQIMHPEKYLQTPHDVPLHVALPPLTDTLGTGWTFKREDTAGEWELLMVLDETKASNSEKAAAGWGGAKYGFYTKGGNDGLLFLHTRWDTVADADEFEAAVREGLDRYGKDGSVWTEGGRYFALKREGRDLFYIASTDRVAVEAAWGAAVVQK